MAEVYSLSLRSDANIKAYYRLNSGALTTDFTANGYTLTNNNSISEVAGKFSGGASSGTGNTNKYLSINNDLGITNGAITVSMWVKINTTPTGSTVTSLFEHGDAASDVRYWIRYNGNSGTPQLSFNRQKENVANNQVTTNHTLSTTAFTHVVLTYDGTDVEGFINGASVGTIGSTGDGSGGVDIDYTYLFAARSQTPAVVFYSDAVIDDVAIFSRALTDAEILRIYKANQQAFFQMF